MEHSESIKEIAAAMSKMQSQLKSIPKNSNNPYYKSKYADLDAIWDGVRKPLTDNGLAVVQTTDKINNELVLVTELIHSSGEWIRSYYPVTPKANDPQSIGSAITYARRYSISAILGVSAEEDDDAEQAMDRDKPQKETNQEKGKQDGELATPAQLNKIFAAGKQMGYSQDDIKLILTKHFKKESSKQLTKAEASEFIEAIESGKRINDKGEWA